ncbi:acylneuraminate cytidylyltransferase family protein, partial [Bacteroides fragilis]
SKEQILKGNILGEKMYPMVVNHIFGEIDIDTREDMSYAEYILLNTKTK